MQRLIALLISLTILATACSGGVLSLSVGDCFDYPDGADEVSDVEILDCGEAHDNEVFATYDLPGSVFPGQDVVQADASAGCVTRFEPYVGSDFETSSLGIGSFVPSPTSWAQDDHEVVCFLNDFDGDTLTASAKGTGI